MDVAGDDGEPTLPSDCGNQGVVDRDRCARLFQLEPHGTLGMCHVTVDRCDLNGAEAGIEPVGIALVVP